MQGMNKKKKYERKASIFNIHHPKNQNDGLHVCLMMDFIEMLI